MHSLLPIFIYFIKSGVTTSGFEILPSLIRNFLHSLFVQIKSWLYKIVLCARVEAVHCLVKPAIHVNKREYPGIVFFFCCCVWQHKRYKKSTINTRRWGSPSKQNVENLESSFFVPLFFFRLIALEIDPNINITIFIYVLVLWFKWMFFLIWNCLKDKSTGKHYLKQPTKLGGNKGIQGKPHATMFFSGFCKL